MASLPSTFLSSSSTLGLFSSHPRRYRSISTNFIQFPRLVRRSDLGLRCSVSTGKEDPETERSFTFRRDSDHVAHFSSVRARFEAMIRNAQDSVCEAIEAVEGGPKFKENVWCLPRGSVQVSRLLEDGNVWEKAEVIVAVIYGDMNPEAYRASASEQNLSPRPFFNAGIRSVLHPRNPFAPTLHFNYRYFETKDVPGAPREWRFGGGTDLSPAYLFEEDVKHFHSIQKQACDKFDPSFYPRFKKWCDDHFCIENRGERRGVGGIFFDGLDDYDEEMLLSFATECARSVVPAYIPIIEKRKDAPFSVLHKAWQQLRRERYVEFKLEKWGLMRKGGIDSELVSFPSNARWDYDIIPEEGTEEWKLLDACINPREWI